MDILAHFAGHFNPTHYLTLTKGLDRHRQMRRTEDHHDNCRRKVMQPDGRAQKVQHGEHRQRHRDKEERTAQQGDLPSARKIADPHGIVQKQEQRGKEKQTLRKLRFSRLTSSVTANR